MAEVIYKETVESLKQCVVADIEEVPKKNGPLDGFPKMPAISKVVLFFQNNKFSKTVFGIGIFQRGQSVLFVCLVLF